VVAIIFNDFPDNQLTSCIYWLIPDFYAPPLSLSLRSPYTMDVPDTHNRQTDKQTDVCLCPFVS